MTIKLTTGDLRYPGLIVERDELAWQGRFSLRLVSFTHRRFDGRQTGTLHWEMWQRPDGSAVLPYDPITDTVVLIDQFRLPALASGVDPIMVEIPAGLIDEGETAESTAYREMQEEAGLQPDRLEYVGDFVLCVGGTNERCTINIGRIQAPDAGPDGVVCLSGLEDENEDIRVRVVKADQAIEDALAGRYRNAVTTLALLWLAAKRSWLQEKWRI